jgi:hypothetical protein
MKEIEAELLSNYLCIKQISPVSDLGVGDYCLWGMGLPILIQKDAEFGRLAGIQQNLGQKSASTIGWNKTRSGLS